MFSYAPKSHSHKSKNLKKNDEDLGGLNLTLRNLSKLQSLNMFFASTKQSRKPLSFIDCNKLQVPTLQKTPKTIAV